LKFAFILLFAGILARAADDQITAPIDSNQRTRLTGHVHPSLNRATDLGILAAGTEISYAAILLRPAPGLESFLIEQQNPSSPEYHKWLTPAQFADRFGLSGSDTARIASWLRSQGLRVHDVALGRHWISFSGSAAQMSNALHTQFHRFAINGETHFANTNDPEVPSAIASVVAGFVGLDDFDLKPMSVKSAVFPEANIGSSHYLAPDDVATIYNITPLYKAGIDGTGQKIAIIGRADINLADIRAFRRRFNLPANDPQVVVVGPDPGATVIADIEEASLDVEWAGAIAPNATIIYVNSRSVTTSLLYAIDQNLAPIVSESFGGCELASQPALRAIGQQANAQGITWIVASGDWGSAMCDVAAPAAQASKGFTVAFPASLPEVTAIGGTKFNEGNGNYWAATNGPNGGSALSYIPEIAWNDSADLHQLVATGGGASALFPKPVWQTGPGVPADGMRDVPDIALNADVVHDGVEVVALGNLLVFGGTSVGAPTFSGMAALLNQYLVAKKAIPAPGLGNINPTLYRLAQSTTDVFHDIISGDNKVPCVQGSDSCVDGLMGVAAAPGYDLTTGLGSVDVNNMVTKWTVGTASVTTLSANPATFNPGDKIQLTATVTGSGSVAPTGTVTFISNDVVLGSAALAGGPVTISADGAIVAGGNGNIVASYSGDGVYNASGASVTATLNLPAKGSLVIPSVFPNPVVQSYTSWPYTIRLDEKAGVATKITAFTVNGVNNLSNLSSTNMPAHGTISANLAGGNLTVPLNRTFHFAGTDADGRTWTQDLTVPFVGPVGRALVPAITLTSAPVTAQANPQADRACAYSQQLIVQETSGFYHLLEQFVVGTTDLSSQIQLAFGTDRLAPFGTLFGSVCWSSNTAPGAKNYQLLGVSEVNSASVASVNTALAPAAATAVSASASPKIVEMLADSISRVGTGTIDLKFGAGSPQWTATIVPARAARWLTLSAAAGSGPARLTLTASGAALSNGVYDATVVVQSTDTIPQANMIRVVFALGRSLSTVIDSVSNAAGRNPTAAPGAMLKITGSNLAPSKASATIVEGALPLALDGVSATVNGIAAPLYSIAPGEIDIQVPYETALGPAALSVNNHGQIGYYIFDVAIAAPEIFKTPSGFLMPAASARQGQTISAYVTGDGDVIPFLATGMTPASGTAPANLPGPGLPVSVKIGDVRVPVSFYGVTPGVVGVTQINFTVPPAAPLGVQPVVVTIGGIASAPASITIAASSATK